jgi:hypothetical protein
MVSAATPNGSRLFGSSSSSMPPRIFCIDINLDARYYENQTKNKTGLDRFERTDYEHEDEKVF